MSKIIRRLVACISSILSFSMSKSNAYINHDKVESKYKVTPLEFNSKIIDNDVKNSDYIDCVLDNNNVDESSKMTLIWDSENILNIPFPETLGEIYKRDGCSFKSSAAHIGWHQSACVWKSVKGNLILIPSGIDRRGMDGNLLHMQSSCGDLENSIKNMINLSENNTNTTNSIVPDKVTSEEQNTVSDEDIENHIGSVLGLFTRNGNDMKLVPLDELPPELQKTINYYTLQDQKRANDYTQPHIVNDVTSSKSKSNKIRKRRKKQLRKRRNKRIYKTRKRKTKKNRYRRHKRHK